MNNLNTGKLVFGLSLRVFQDLLRQFQNQGVFDSLSTQQVFPVLEGNDSLTLTVHVEVLLEPIHFLLKTPSNAPKYTVLTLEGKVKMRVSSPTAQSPDLFDLPFLIGLKISPILKARENQAPVIGLLYGGLDQLEGPLPQAFVENLIQSQGFSQLLEDFELDLVEPVLSGLEELLFLGEDKPNHADWAVGLHLLKGGGQHVDSLALVLDVPGASAAAPQGGSFVPKRAEVIVQFSDSLVQALVEEAKEELKSWFEEINGVDLRVSRLDLTVGGNQLYLDAKFVEKDYDVEVTIKGPIGFRHGPGSLMMQVDIKGLEIDIDLPWWADFLAFLLDALTLGTIGVNHTIHQRIPNFAQNYAQKFLNQSLSNLGKSLSLETLHYQGVKAEVYPDWIALEDGAITAYIQVLGGKISEPLIQADYSKLRERFVMFHLGSGRRFLAEDLAKFMEAGWVEVPGYHPVAGRYIRSNPDQQENNNLEKRFSR